jgi:hypothetical protein
MPDRRVQPILVTVRRPDAPKDLLEAFIMGEQAQLAKIADWSVRFGFETTEPVVIDLMDESAPEILVEQILERTYLVGATGVVAAGIELVRRAQILEALYERLGIAHLDLWGANLGSLPITDLIHV